MGNLGCSHGECSKKCRQKNDEDGVCQAEEEDDGIVALGIGWTHAYIRIVKMMSVKSKRKANASRPWQRLNTH